MNEEGFIDLHLHSYASDGNLSPAQIVCQAKKIGLRAIAIADHDTIDGLAKGMEAARQAEIEFIPAVELTTLYAGGETHILGYFIDLQNKPLLQRFIEAKTLREERIFQMTKRLASLGITVSYQRLKDRYSFIERFQLALEMLEQGYVQTVDEAYQGYLNPGAPAYIPLQTITTEEAIALIKSSGGIAVLSHPGGFDLNAKRFSKKEIIYLKGKGLDGLEVYSIFHNQEKTEYFYNLARNLNLAISGGSDCHGDAYTQDRIGCLKINYSVLVQLRTYITNKDI